MPRYRLQEQDKDKRFEDTEIVFNTKQQLEDFIGFYGQDYDWRAGYTFKHFDNPVSRFVWNCGKKKGEEVKV